MLEPQPSQSAIGIVSRRWTLEILRAVAAGPRRHRDLLGALGGDGDPVHNKTLSSTLASLSEHGLITRRILSERPRAVVYESTPLGLQLLDILETLTHFFDEHEAELKARRTGDMR